MSRIILLTSCFIAAGQPIETENNDLPQQTDADIRSRIFESLESLREFGIELRGIGGTDFESVLVRGEECADLIDLLESQHSYIGLRAPENRVLVVKLTEDGKALLMRPKNKTMSMSTLMSSVPVFDLNGVLAWQDPVIRGNIATQEVLQANASQESFVPLSFIGAGAAICPINATTMHIRTQLHPLNPSMFENLPPDKCVMVRCEVEGRPGFSYAKMIMHNGKICFQSRSDPVSHCQKIPLINDIAWHEADFAKLKYETPEGILNTYKATKAPEPGELVRSQNHAGGIEFTYTAQSFYGKKGVIVPENQNRVADGTVLSEFNHGMYVQLSCKKNHCILIPVKIQGKQGLFCIKIIMPNGELILKGDEKTPGLPSHFIPVVDNSGNYSRVDFSKLDFVAAQNSIPKPNQIVPEPCAKPNITQTKIDKFIDKLGELGKILMNCNGQIAPIECNSFEGLQSSILPVMELLEIMESNQCVLIRVKKKDGSDVLMKLRYADNGDIVMSDFNPNDKIENLTFPTHTFQKLIQDWIGENVEEIEGYYVTYPLKFVNKGEPGISIQNVPDLAIYSGDGRNYFAIRVDSDMIDEHQFVIFCLPESKNYLNILGPNREIVPFDSDHVPVWSRATKQCLYLPSNSFQAFARRGVDEDQALGIQNQVALSKPLIKTLEKYGGIIESDFANQSIHRLQDMNNLSFRLLMAEQQDNHIVFPCKFTGQEKLLLVKLALSEDVLKLREETKLSDISDSYTNITCFDLKGDPFNVEFDKLTFYKPGNELNLGADSKIIQQEMPWFVDYVAPNPARTQVANTLSPEKFSDKGAVMVGRECFEVMENEPLEDLGKLWATLMSIDSPEQFSLLVPCRNGFFRYCVKFVMHEGKLCFENNGVPEESCVEVPLINKKGCHYSEFNELIFQMPGSKFKKVDSNMQSWLLNAKGFIDEIDCNPNEVCTRDPATVKHLLELKIGKQPNKCIFAQIKYGKEAVWIRIRMVDENIMLLNQDGSEYNWME